MTDDFDALRRTPEAIALQSLLDIPRSKGGSLLLWAMNRNITGDPVFWVEEQWRACGSPKDLYMFAATVGEATEQHLARIQSLDDLLHERSSSYPRILVALARKALHLESPSQSRDDAEYLLSLVEQMHQAYREERDFHGLLRAYFETIEEVPGDNADWVYQTGSLSLRAIDVVRRKVSYPGGIHGLLQVLQPVGAYVLCTWLRDIVPWATLKPCVQRIIRYLHHRELELGL